MADDATVEVEGEEVFEEEINLENANPNFLLKGYHSTTSFLAAYGWSVVVVTVLLMIVWSNIESRVRKIFQKKDIDDPVESNPERLAQRAEGMELARQRMQERASEILKKESERRKELEEQKRQEKIEDYDAMKTGKSSHAAQRKVGANEKAQQATTSNNPQSRPAARPLRSDYNPLTGSTSGPRYRPPPRSSGG